MKFPLGRIKKWKPVWVGTLAGLGLGVGSIFLRILTTKRANPFNAHEAALHRFNGRLISGTRKARPSGEKRVLAARRRMQLGPHIVVAGVPPAVEPGILPGGTRRESLQRTRDFTDFGKLRAIIPGGRMPPSTAARMAAVTTPMQAPGCARWPGFAGICLLRRVIHA